MYGRQVNSCNIYWPENEYMNGQAAFTLYTFTLAFAIPLVLILVFYILVLLKLQVKKTTKTKVGSPFGIFFLDGSPLFFLFCFVLWFHASSKTVGPAKKSKEKKRSHRKVTRLVLTVVAVYVLCWLPYWVSQVRYSFFFCRMNE